MKTRRRHWTPEEKTHLSAEARLRMEAGETLASIARSLDVRRDSLSRWLQVVAQPTAELAPVRVAHESVAASDPSSPIALVTPDGFSFEGLSLAEAVALWERLR